MSEVLAASPLVRAIGVAIVEFLWQGALIALVAAGALRALRGSDPVTRYVVSCLALAAMALAPVATAVVAYRAAAEATASAVLIAHASPGAVAAALSAAPLPATTLTTILAREEWMPVVVAAWSVGVMLCGLHLATSWLLVNFVRNGAVALSRRSQQHLAQLAGRLGIARSVRIAESVDVVVPTVMGWVRPLILVPTSTLAGLSSSELEAILVHELAHVRRHDYLVNVVQGVVETMLFYHPGVWWMSRRIRVERELCCDDLVVSVCGDRLTYAKALASLETHRMPTPALAVAADGGDLLGRIRRLLGVAPAERSTTSIGGVLAVLVALPFFFIGEAAASARTAATHRGAPAPAMTSQPAARLMVPTVLSNAPGGGAADLGKLQARYEALASLVRRYNAFATQAAPAVPPVATAQGAQPAAPPPAPAVVDIEQLQVLLAEAKAQLQAGHVAEASNLLNQLAAAMNRLPSQAPTTSSQAGRPAGDRVGTTATSDSGAAGRTMIGGDPSPVTAAPPPPPPAPPAAPAYSGDAPLRVGGDVKAPTKIRDVVPVYPEEARAAKVQGIVIIEAVIDQGGNVVDTRVLRGVPLLDYAAVQAVSQWKFTSPTLNGAPVSVIMTVTVNFTVQ